MTTLARVLDALKPHRAEALQRVRTNAFCLVLLIILSYLLPIPSISNAFSHTLRLRSTTKFFDERGRRVVSTVPVSVPPIKWSLDAAYSWVCTIESAVVTIFLFNVLQGIYALKYPRTTPHLTPSSTSPSRSKKSAPTTPTSHPFKSLSPKYRSKNSTPQKPFTFSPTHSTATNSSTFSTGSKLGKSNPYPSTPADTPSRKSVHYSLPSLDASLDFSPESSTASGLSPLSSSVFAGSVPVIAAWRGKHVPSEIGRPLDGSFLGHISVAGQGETEAEVEE
ncbi:hypothetical protein AX15_004595 [Amanita polypyramis BW_CC]|nr:hypothetical protein AX15_004595 [Amanita polypyramis BW_CC]